MLLQFACGFNYGCMFIISFVNLDHALGLTKIMNLKKPMSGKCSEHGPICHLFKLILVIHANTSNGTNHIV
jgi:hypothetical protein